MRKFFFSVAVATIAFASGPVAADQRDGPYYATPSWDQQLSVSDRFVVLTNWNNEAVLDRETGLVWQRTPSGVSKDHNWALAVDACKDETTGGRFGWRLPAVDDLSTLIDATTTTIPFAPPSGAPFTLPPGPTAFWTATTFAQSPA